MANRTGDSEKLFLAESKPPATKEESETDSRKRPRREDPFETYLEERLEATLPFPAILEDLLGLLHCDAECPGWAASKDDEMKRCEWCKQSAAYHQANMNKEEVPITVALMAAVRNLRCLASYRLLEHGHVDKSVIEQGLWVLGQSLRDFDEPAFSVLRSKVQKLGILIRNDPHLKTFQQSLHCIMACDECYYQMYRLQLTGSIPMKHVGNRGIPHPIAYFGPSHCTLDWTRATAILQDRVQKIPSASGLADDIQERYAPTLDDDDDQHPLSALHHYRLVETVSYFSQINWHTPQLAQKTWEQAHRMNYHWLEPLFASEEKTPAPQLLMEWRDSCHDFLSQLYSPATLSSESLQQISDMLPQQENLTGIVEVGDGTGYLARVLSDMGINVQAVDVVPPNGNVHKEYHRFPPLFHPVQSTDFDSLPDLSHKALLLCCLPHETAMAYDALQAYLQKGGRTLFHIGEFKGRTGSEVFELVLREEFFCVDRHPCLTWGTDGAELTIWHRIPAFNTGEFKRLTTLAALERDPCLALRSDDAELSTPPPPLPSLLLPCSHCRTSESVKRFRMIRYLTFCSQNCLESHRLALREHMRWSLIDLADDKLDLSNKDVFAQLYTSSC